MANIYKDLLENTTIKENKNFLEMTEYRDKYNSARFENREATSNSSYVSKKAGDESDFWKEGKYCYDDPILKSKMVYLPNSCESYKKIDIPTKFKSKEFNRTVTRISEFSNAKYNGCVFKNPTFTSC